MMIFKKKHSNSFFSSISHIKLIIFMGSHMYSGLLGATIVAALTCSFLLLIAYFSLKDSPNVKKYLLPGWVMSLVTAILFMLFGIFSVLSPHKIKAVEQIYLDGRSRVKISYGFAPIVFVIVCILTIVYTILATISYQGITSPSDSETKNFCLFAVILCYIEIFFIIVCFCVYIYLPKGNGKVVGRRMTNVDIESSPIGKEVYSGIIPPPSTTLPPRRTRRIERSSTPDNGRRRVVNSTWKKENSSPVILSSSSSPSPSSSSSSSSPLLSPIQQSYPGFSLQKQEEYGLDNQIDEEDDGEEVMVESIENNEEEDDSPSCPVPSSSSLSKPNFIISKRPLSLDSSSFSSSSPMRLSS